MINARKSLRGNKTAEVNMAPLIDLVFLLLIFFMVTTSFVRESGVDVERPQASTATLKDAGNILIGVTATGKVFMESREIDVRSVRAHVEHSLADNPEGAVVIVADKKSNTGVVIEVLDQCRLAGATNVSIAASKNGGNISS